MASETKNKQTKKTNFNQDLAYNACYSLLFVLEHCGASWSFLPKADLFRDLWTW